MRSVWRLTKLKLKVFASASHTMPSIRSVRRCCVSSEESASEDDADICIQNYILCAALYHRRDRQDLEKMTAIALLRASLCKIKNLAYGGITKIILLFSQ